MRRLIAVSLVALAMTAGVARAGSIGVGAFGGMSFPVLQDDVDKGSLYGVRVPVKLVPLVSLEPWWASAGLGDKTMTVAGISYTRTGFDETAYGLNAMLTMGGPVSFYPIVGIGSTKLTRPGSADKTGTTYNFGLGLGFSPMPKLSVHVRGELQAVSDGAVSRKFVNSSLGASYALFSIP